MSVGHDEYWSKEQRANVEAARDAGVNLAFFTGNEVFWKTRWEPSIDGSATDWRTARLLQGDEGAARSTRATTWTGTWRDPRFSPPKDGGQPENALLGNIFTVNGRRDDALRSRRVRQDAALAQHAAREHGRRSDLHASSPGRSATSGTRSRTTASSPRASRSCRDDGRTSTAVRAAELRRHLRVGTQDARPDALPRSERGAGLRRRARCSGRGGSTTSTPPTGTPTVRRPDAAGDGQPARRHGRPAGHPAVRARRRDRRAPTPPPRRSTITRPPRPPHGRPAVHRSPARSPTPAAAGRRRRGVDRRRRPPGTRRRGSRSRPGPTPARRPAPGRRRCGPRGRRQRQLSAPRQRIASRSARAQCPCTIWPDTARPAVPTRPTTGSVELGVKWRSDDARLRTRRAVLQGRRQHRDAHRRPVVRVRAAAGDRHVQRTRRRPAGRQIHSPRRSRSGRTPPTSSRTTPRPVTTPPTLDYFTVQSAAQEPLTALRSGTDGANGVYTSGARRLPDAVLQRHQLLGRRRCGRPTRDPTPGRRRHRHLAGRQRRNGRARRPPVGDLRRGGGPGDRAVRA